MLQWGRNFIVAETFVPFFVVSFIVSLLQWGRNFIVAEIPDVGRVYGSIKSFNGAATLSLRRLVAVSKELVTLRSFNGAATLSLRRRDKRLAGDVQTGRASMGPQLYRCGDPIPETMSPVMPCLKLQWGRNFIVAETSSFGSDTELRVGQLQWGRNFIVAETRISLRSHKYDSKYTLQWGRNFIVAETLQPYWPHLP